MSEPEMPDSLTPTDPGMPSPLAARVLHEAQALLGRHEEGGENQGEIVELVAAPFLSLERIARFMKGGDKEGDLEWCALFVSYCWWRATLAAPADGQKEASWFRPYASSEVSVLWQRLDVEGWTWAKDLGAGDVGTIEGNAGDEVRARSYHLSDPQVYGFARPRLVGPHGAPMMADIIFFVKTDAGRRPKFKADGSPDFRHVGLVQRYAAPGAVG